MFNIGFMLHCFTMLFLNMLINQTCWAVSWPVFLPPNPTLLQNLNLMDTNSCPKGQGKLLANATINIQQHLCRSYCPPSWDWVGISDNQCHPLSAFRINHYDIKHIRDEEGNTRYSIVAAKFGDKIDGVWFATFTFTSPQNYWYCIEMNPELKTITCANDI